MNSDQEAINVMANEIQKYVEAVVSHSSFDKTVKARIISRLGNTNTYLIMINGCEYNALSSYDLHTNDIVYATLVQNNYNDIIINMPAIIKLKEEKL